MFISPKNTIKMILAIPFKTGGGRYKELKDSHLHLLLRINTDIISSAFNTHLYLLTSVILSRVKKNKKYEFYDNSIIAMAPVQFYGLFQLQGLWQQVHAGLDIT